MNKSKANQNKSEPPQRIEDKERRVNLKCKRKRNLFKKAIELSTMCEMDVLIVLRDRDTGRFQQYSSGSKLTGQFTVEKVQSDIVAHKAVGRKVKILDDSDYGRVRLLSASDKLDLDLDELPKPQNKRRKADKGLSFEASLDASEDNIRTSIKKAKDLC